MDLYDNAEVAGRLTADHDRYRTGGLCAARTTGDTTFSIPYVEQFVKAAGRRGSDPSAAATDPAYSGAVSDGAEFLASDWDVAAGKAATDSTGTASANVNDETFSTTSFGTCGSEDCYAQIDLGGVYDIDKVNVYCGGVNTLYKYEIQVSRTVQPSPRWGQRPTIRWSSRTAIPSALKRFLPGMCGVVGKYYNKGNSSNKYAFSVGEIAVYGVINEGKTFEGKELFVITPDTVTLPKDTGTLDKLSDGNKISDPLVIGVIHGGNTYRGYDRGKGAFPRSCAS